MFKCIGYSIFINRSCNVIGMFLHFVHSISHCYSDGGMAQQQIQAQPDAAHHQSHQRQTHQHFLTSLLVPPPQGAGDRQKHPPGHGKPVQPLTQKATLLSTGGAVPPSAHIPRQIPPPACGRSPQGPGGTSPSTSHRSRRPATARRRRR